MSIKVLTWTQLVTILTQLSCLCRASIDRERFLKVRNSPPSFLKLALHSNNAYRELIYGSVGWSQPDNIDAALKQKFCERCGQAFRDPGGPQNQHEQIK